jgi:class 3 adenylate cyclase
LNVFLVSQQPESLGDEYRFTSDVMKVGRDESNDIVLQRPGVSRYHARITRNGAVYAIEDLRSSNGTWLNDVRVTGKAFLNDGDSLRFDDAAFVFRNDDAAARTVARAPSHAHETVTVMFADLVGHTALFESLGSEAVERLIDERVGMMKTQVARAGGRVVKTEGDAVMASFSSIRQAVSCAVEIQRSIDALEGGEAQMAPVRIGINSGEALKQDDDLIGIAVIKAARVMAEAGGGEIYLSEISRGLLGPTTALKIKPKGFHQLKGISRRERLFEVLWR